MIRYVAKRLLIAIPTFVGITILVYFLSSLAPGTPLEMILSDPNTTAEQMEVLKQRYGLDKPVYIQYLNRCSKATKFCAQVEPELTEVEAGHFAACHLYSNPQEMKG